MELVIAGNTYATGKLDAIKQFHVARRMAPVLLSLAGAMGSVQAVLAGASDVDALGAMSPIADALGALSDTDAEYVIHACMGVTQRQSGHGWAKVFVAGGGFAFQDIDMTIMMQLVIATLRENMANFLPALLAPPAAAGA